MNFFDHQLDHQVMLIGPEPLAITYSVAQFQDPVGLPDNLQLRLSLSRSVAVDPSVTVSLGSTFTSSTMHPTPCPTSNSRRLA